MTRLNMKIDKYTLCLVALCFIYLLVRLFFNQNDWLTLFFACSVLIVGMLKIRRYLQ
jgi:hypothetical protein